MTKTQRLFTCELYKLNRTFWIYFIQSNATFGDQVVQTCQRCNVLAASWPSMWSRHHYHPFCGSTERLQGESKSSLGEVSIHRRIYRKSQNEKKTQKE